MSADSEARIPQDLKAEWAELATTIAHELKGPVASIKGLAVTGARLYHSLTDDERLEFFHLIDIESTRLAAIADEASTAFRISSGALRYHIRPEPIAPLVKEAVSKVTQGAHPIKVDAEGELTVPCDRVWLIETLVNVVDNASKFSPLDAPIEIRAFEGDGGRTALVEVTDHGPGIPPAERERVFERFSKWRPKGYEKTPGAGLGLFISRAHIKAHGGTIDIEDGPENGALLRLKLPMGGRGD